MFNKIILYRDGRLVNKLGLPLGRPAPKSPTLQTYTKPPICESEHSSDWLVHEDWAVLQVCLMLIGGYFWEKNLNF